MVKVIDCRDTGKTKKLLSECAKVDGVFVCKHPERVSEKCAAYGIPLVRAVGYEDLKYLVGTSEKEPISSSSVIYIDELEEFVETLIPNLRGYSLTTD